MNGVHICLDQTLLFLTIEVEEGHIQTIRVVANPDKLAQV
jgi:hypothetical protein